MSTGVYKNPLARYNVQRVNDPNNQAAPGPAPVGSRLQQVTNGPNFTQYPSLDTEGVGAVTPTTLVVAPGGGGQLVPNIPNGRGYAPGRKLA
jgi:hypothetical protein